MADVANSIGTNRRTLERALKGYEPNEQRARLQATIASEQQIVDELTAAGGYAEVRKHQQALITAWNKAYLVKESVVWESGAIAYIFSPEAPNKPRDANLSNTWLTEVAHYPRNTGLKLFHNITTPCRVSPARVLIDTTTHGRSDILDHLCRLNAEDPKRYPITSGETWQNTMLIRYYHREQYLMYVGRTAREELWGEYCTELDGANWERAWITDHRVEEPPPLEVRIMGVAPAESTRADADDTGMVTCDRDRAGHIFLLSDRSGKHTPESLARAVLDAHRDGCVGTVVETNRGGHFVVGMIRAYATSEGVQVDDRASDKAWPQYDRRKLYVKQVHNRGAKYNRHAGAAALAKQGRLHHVGTYVDIEDMMCSYTGDEHEVDFIIAHHGLTARDVQAKSVPVKFDVDGTAVSINVINPLHCLQSRVAKRRTLTQ